MPNEIDDDDYPDEWDDERFEHIVASALIACYETNVKKNRGAAPADRLTEERVALFRKAGPYIPAPSRYVIAHVGSRGFFDVDNDPLPQSGCLALQPGPAYHNKRAYLFIMYFRRAAALGKYWHKQAPGVIYEMFTMGATTDGIEGERRFFTVSKHGEVVACNQRVHIERGYKPGHPSSVCGPDDDWKTETAAWGSYALQWFADRRFCWTITAQEQTARAHLGCMKEEIKSLLYARSLPMTTTGRKRPILHLVEAHQRRLRNGIDIDVTAFLRGTQTVEIGGTVFSVRAPEVLRPRLSEPSVRRYYEPQELSNVGT